MSIRLAFSIATVSAPEILLIDEVLSVGDRAFQLKARARMKNLMASANLMVMVSHDLDSVKAMCNRVVWLSKGGIAMTGPTAEVVAAYENSVPTKAAA
jgi:ABC-type polysaccharide/polyol phosphate transport system ATPase subunit